MKRILAPLLFAMLGCAAAPPPQPIDDARRVNPLAFEVEAPQGTRAVLFGSVHLARAKDWDLPGPLHRALERAEVLVFEIDVSETTQTEVLQIMLALGVMPPGQRLRQVVSDETWTLLEERAPDSGVPIEALDRLKPWVVALQFVSESLRGAGFDPEHGVESGIVQLDRDLPIRGLETPFEQLSVFDGLPYPVQDRMLLDALRRPVEDETQEIDALLDAWRRGDAHALEAIVFKDRDDPRLARFYEVTYDRRNLHMAESLEAILLEGKRAFVVVGVGHLVGERGLPSVLLEAGFRVRQVSGIR